jgi:hypothetical protein
VEPKNQAVKDALQKVGAKSAAELGETLTRVAWANNTADNESIGTSPYKAFYGEPAVDRLGAALGWTQRRAAGAAGELLAAVRTLVAVRSHHAFEKAKRAHDKSLEKAAFEAGQAVLVCTPAHRKLDTAWRGVWTVVERVGKLEVLYRV